MNINVNNKQYSIIWYNAIHTTHMLDILFHIIPRFVFLSIVEILNMEWGGKLCLLEGKTNSLDAHPDI